MKVQDSYGEPKIFTYPGMTIKVYSPILSDEERTARMKQIYKAAEMLLKSKQ